MHTFKHYKEHVGSLMECWIVCLNLDCVLSDFLQNPQQTTSGVFRARDINFYPPNTGSGARLGELAITGGRISSEFNIVPRN